MACRLPCRKCSLEQPVCKDGLQVGYSASSLSFRGSEVGRGLSSGINERELQEEHSVQVHIETVEISVSWGLVSLTVITFHTVLKLPTQIEVHSWWTFCSKNLMIRNASSFADITPGSCFCHRERLVFPGLRGSPLNLRRLQTCRAKWGSSVDAFSANYLLDT